MRALVGELAPMHFSAFYMGFMSQLNGMEFRAS